MSQLASILPALSTEPPVPGVPLIDIQRQYAQIKDQIAASVQAVLASGQFVLGPETEKLEKELASYSQCAHAIGCASGSDALLLALMALDIGPGDEVIMPSYTFFATASAAWRLGARPVFCDIEPAHFNLNVDLIEELITPRTKAIMPVHLYGQCAEMGAILDIARRHRLAVIEDAAQAVGAEYEGRRAGSLGDIGCLSFYPTKNLGGCGDGGMLLTNRTDLAERLRLLRGHGMAPRYYHKVVGINSRLDSLQAAVLRVKLPYLDDWTTLRQVNAQRYTELFASCGLDRVLALPSARPDVRHVWNQYIVRVPGGRRDALREHLKLAKIGTEIYYPVPVHLQECFQPLGYQPGSLPESERAAVESLALPIFPELTAAEQMQVVAHISNFFGTPWPKPGHRLEGPRFLRRSESSAAQHS
jgi:dTDP-4-amino-4,6-dideoxygalactose transaminase